MLPVSLRKTWIHLFVFFTGRESKKRRTKALGEWSQSNSCIDYFTGSIPSQFAQGLWHIAGDRPTCQPNERSINWTNEQKCEGMHDLANERTQAPTHERMNERHVRRTHEQTEARMNEKTYAPTKKHMHQIMYSQGSKRTPERINEPTRKWTKVGWKVRSDSVKNGKGIERIFYSASVINSTSAFLSNQNAFAPPAPSWSVLPVWIVLVILG